MWSGRKTGPQRGWSEDVVYEAQLRQRGLSFYALVHRITVINRGSWGELRFTLQH